MWGFLQGILELNIIWRSSFVSFQLEGLIAHTAAKPMLDKCDEASPTSAQKVTRDSMPENVTRDRISLRVSDHLLDLMAADDESRHLAALKSLEEKRKITRAEMYLRKKFRYLRQKIRRRS